MRLVMANGCFDLLTVGHVRHLEASKRLGDVLVVLVTADANVGKGPDRPVVPEAERVEMVSALKCVDRVILNRDGLAGVLRWIAELRPAVYAKGSEYLSERHRTAGLVKEMEAVVACGGRVEFTATNERHTTETLNGLRKALTWDSSEMTCT